MKRIVPVVAIVIVLSLIGLLFWYVNGTRGFVFEHQIKTDLAPAQAFRVFVDKPLRKQWSDNRVNFEYVTKGPFQVGTAYTYSVVDGDKVYAFREEVVELDRPLRLVVKMETEPFDATMTYTFERVGEETIIKVVADGFLKGRARWGSSIARSAIEEKVRGDLEALGIKLNRNVELRMLLENTE